MAGGKDKEGRKVEVHERKEEAKAKESSESETEEDPDEMERKLLEQLALVKRKAADKKAAKELEAKEQERLRQLAAQLLLAGAPKTGEAGAGGSGGSGGGSDKKRNHMSLVVIRTFMPHVSPEKSVTLTLWETPQQLLLRERNFVKDAMMAKASGNDGQLMILQEGDTYMVFDVRDNK